MTWIGSCDQTHDSEVGFRQFIYETDPRNEHGPKCDVIEIKHIKHRVPLCPMIGSDGACRRHHGPPLPRHLRREGADLYLLNSDMYLHVAQG